MRALRLFTTPGRCASACRIRNSVTVSVTGSPFQVQVWRSGSMVSWPRSNALASVLGGGKHPGPGDLSGHPPQQLHAVHARHLDVEDGEVGRRLAQAVEG